MNIMNITKTTKKSGKKLNTSKIDSSFCMTRRELVGWLLSTPAFDDSTPIVLKCNGRNYRLGAFNVVAGKPILVGRRGKRDA